MTIDTEMLDDLVAPDEAYFDDKSERRRRSFDARLLQEPLTLLPSRSPLVFAESATVKDAWSRSNWACTRMRRSLKGALPARDSIRAK